MSFAAGFHEPGHLQGSSFSPADLSSTAAAYGVLLLISIYYILQYFDLTNLPLSELMWNSSVYITPARLVSMLDSGFSTITVKDPEEKNTGFDSKAHASKSNAMRRILGLDGTGLMTTVQRTRTLSNLGGVFKATPKTGLPGLGNWDNSCYQNSVLQGIAALQSLPEFLGQSAHENASQPTKRALRETIEKLNNPENVGKTFWTPAELKSMSSWQQQDAQEYFSKISDQLEKDTAKDLARKAGRVGWEKLYYEGVEYPSGSPESESTAVSRRASSVAQLPEEVSSLIIRNPLEGLLAQRVGCQRCDYVEGLSMVPFNCLTVPLGRQWMYDVRECLDEFTALEPISGVECAKCTLFRAKQQMEQLLSHLKSSEGGSYQPPKEVNENLRLSVQERLSLVNQALEDEDFSDQVLKKCQIPPKQRVLTTKSRQAVVARTPRSLVIHINRSNFDELTGMQSKNLANVNFPQQLDLAPWCLGNYSTSLRKDDAAESWNVDPSESMLDINQNVDHLASGRMYELRAVVTHYGRHENGHYICYRKSPYNTKPQDGSGGKSSECWWRLSDEDVTEVDEEIVLAQGGVFMLFYEQVESIASGKKDQPKIADEASETSGAAISGEASEPITDAPPESPTSVSPLHLACGERLTAAPYPTPPMSPQVSGIAESANDAIGSSRIAQSIPRPKASERVHTSTPPIPEKSPKRSAPEVSTKSVTLPSPGSKPAAPTIPEPPKLSDTASESVERLALSPTTSKENGPISPASMRTAGPCSGRGSVSRAGKAMGSVAGFVQAN